MDKTAAFKQFYLENYESVFRFVRGILKSAEDAEDVAQESFYRLYRAWDTISSDRYACAWTFAVARNLSIDRLKSKSKSHADEEVLAILSSDEEFLEDLFAREAARIIETAIAGLPEQTGKVAWLVYMGMTNPEIAQELGISVNTVKSLRKKAYEKLRKELGGIFLLSLFF